VRPPPQHFPGGAVAQGEGDGRPARVVGSALAREPPGSPLPRSAPVPWGSRMAGTSLRLPAAVNVTAAGCTVLRLQERRRGYSPLRSAPSH